MHGKFLFALAACLPLALAGCGGGTPASSTASPSGDTGRSGTRTPAAALDAAKAAVDNADSERTEAAVRRARGALSQAVETAEAALAAARTDLNAAQAALKEAQDYRAEQAAVLDGLQPISDLAAAETASATLALEASAALNAAKTAMARATRLRTEAAIRAARRALSEAVEKAEASLASMRVIVRGAEAELKEAQDYRDAQSTILDSIPFTRLPGSPLPPSSPPGEFKVTHVERSFAYLKQNTPNPGSAAFIGFCLGQGFHPERCPDEVGMNGETFSDSDATPRYSRHNQINQIFRWGRTTELRPERDESGAGRLPPLESYWQSIRDDARDLKNGFRRIRKPNGITIAQKDFRRTFPRSDATRRDSYDRYVVGIGSYGAFEILSAIVQSPDRAVPYDGGFASAFGERSVVAPGWIRPRPGNPPTRFVYRGAMAAVRHENRGEGFTGSATLTYRPHENGDMINLDLREHLGQGVYGPWRHTRNMSVNNDGSFSDASNSVKGNFYGPNWEESTGIVQTDDVYGAWLVHRPYRFSTESDTGGSYVFGQHTGPPFPRVDFVQ